METCTWKCTLHRVLKQIRMTLCSVTVLQKSKVIDNTKTFLVVILRWP